MKITEHQMRGLLAGKCLPGDMRVNEDLSSYLVRKFDESQQKMDALAAENAALKDLQPTQQMITAAHRELEEYDNIQIDDDAVVFTWQAMRAQQKTPATDAYLNSVRAEGVEMFAAKITKTVSDEGKPDSHHAYAYIAMNFADKLRSGTHDTANKAG